MSRKSISILVLLLVAIPAVYCLRPSDERRIKRIFTDGKRAIESENLEGVMSKVSYNYRDDYGFTYLYLKETLKKQFEELSDITGEYYNLNIRVSKDTATADVDVRVIATKGNETGYIIGDARSPAHLKFNLDKERTKWLIVRLEGFSN